MAALIGERLRRPAPSGRHFLIRRCGIAATAGFIALFWLATSTPAIAQAKQPLSRELPPRALQQIAAIQAEKASRVGAQRKISSALLFGRRQRQGLPAVAGVTLRLVPLDVDERDRVLVDIDADVTPGLEQAVVSIGGDLLDMVPEFSAVRARVPLAVLEVLAGRTDVRRIRPAEMPILRKVNTSQGDTAHRASLARESSGATGAGVGVGVLSDGVTTLALRQGTGDLPPGVTVLPGQAGTGDEGTAMLEIVHDLAPGAPLFFATATGGEARFASNIVDLCNAGAKVLVGDTGYATEPVFEDGVIAQAVNTVTSNGCHFVSAAGNDGNFTDGTASVWEGDFVPGPLTNFGTFHLFDGVASNALIADAPGRIVLKWADKWGASGNDYDLFLFNADLSIVVSASVDVQSGDGFPVETIDSSMSLDAGNRLVVAQYMAANRYLHLNTFSGRLQFTTPGQIHGHAAAERAIAVAAVDVATAGGGPFVGGVANPVEAFSSDGPRRMFFAPDGQPYTPGNFSSSGGIVRQKPEIAAADRVVTSTPGFDLFAGTSAAASHVAAMAALTLSAAGGPGALTVDALRSTLFSATVDIEAPGIDRDSGYGILDAYRAVMAVIPTPSCTYSINPTSASFANSGGSGSVAVTASVGCPWTATANASFITVTSGSSGTGAGSVTYSVASTTSPRTGTISIAGLAFSITQNNPSFTDDPLTTSHFVRAVHITELRQRIDALRQARGLGPYLWTDPTITPGVTTVRAVHLTELRGALVQVYSLLARTPPAFTDPNVAVGSTPIRTAHITELRDAVRAIE